MSYIPRLTVPTNGDPYYTRIAYGGLNPCIAGDPEAWTGSALANCVGYTTGRWYELLGYNPNLCPYDAKYWWGYTDGYTRGYEPQLGSIICFDATSGHVAVVEQIIDSNTIVTSNSAYHQTIFYTQTLYRSNNWTWNSAFIFQGFIYLPTQPIPQPEYIQYILKRKRIL